MKARDEAEKQLKDSKHIQNNINSNAILDPPSTPYKPQNDSFTEDSLPPLEQLDRQFFLSCQKLKVGKVTSVEKLDEFVENGASVNTRYFTSGDPSCWDVMMKPVNVMQSTQFSWPCPEHRAVYGDTLLHIAIKTKDKAILGFLANREDVDLNAMNGDGMTASMVADVLGFQNMYNYFFIMK